MIVFANIILIKKIYLLKNPNYIYINGLYNVQPPPTNDIFPIFGFDEP
jgi:hypothetical protein